jgi:16S rRNA (cytosine1402-N4)-methyltransferase
MRWRALASRGPEGLEPYHIPVLVEETVALLVTRRDGTYIDGTAGGGGHTGRLLAALGADARVLALDRDPGAVRVLGTCLGGEKRVIVRRGAFGELARIAEMEGLAPVDGVLLDLGVSSRQIDDPRLGFTYREDAPLDMRMDPDLPVTAADLLARLDERELTELFREGGEVPNARALARAVVRGRDQAPLERSADLRRIVEAHAPPRARTQALSRVFQALRIRVNDEFGQLEAGLAGAMRTLRAGGRLAVIAYHSLEDRRVKHYLREKARGCICPPDFPVCACGHSPELRVLTPRAVRPSEAELAANPRSRSARLRVAERTAEGAAG